MHIPSIRHHRTMKLQRLNEHDRRPMRQLEQTPQKVFHVGRMFGGEVFVVDAQFDDNKRRIVRDVEGGAEAKVVAAGRWQEKVEGRRGNGGSAMV